MANKSGGGGKFLTGLLCFILGFIICIAAEAAVIAGGVYWLYSSDLESIFSTLGIENTEDDGSGGVKYIYINTDEVTTVSELVSAISGLASKDTSELCLNDFTNILPIADSVVDTVYSTVADLLGIDEDEVRDKIDEDELKDTPFTELLDYIVNCIKDFELTILTDMLGMDIEDESNSLYLALIYGSEAATVTYNGEQYVLYYDSYDYDESTGIYTRTADGTTTLTGDNAVYIDYLFSSAGGYKLYYMVATDGTAYIVTRSSGTYTLAEDASAQQASQAVSYSLTSSGTNSLIKYTLYSEELATLSGAYYKDSSGTYVYLTSAKTIGDVMDNINDLFNDIYLSDLLTDSTLVDMFDGISIGDLINDDDISDTLLNNIYLTDFIGDDADDLLYEIFDGKTIGDIMNSDDVVTDLFGDVLITDLFDDSADETIKNMFEGYTVADLFNGNFSTENIDIGSLMSVEPTNTVMAFIAYNISSAEASTGTVDILNDDNQTETIDYQYTATLHVFTDNGNGGEDDNQYAAVVVTEVNSDGDTVISAVYYDADGDDIYEEAPAVSVSDISKQSERLMDCLTIGEITDLGDSAIADKLSDYTVNNISEFIDNLTIEDVIGDVAMDDSAIIKYLVYGVSIVDDVDYPTTYTDADGEVYNVYKAIYYAYGDTTAAEPADKNYLYDEKEVYVLTYEKEGEEVIYGVYGEYTGTAYENQLTATLVNYVSDRIDGLMEDLTIGEITELDESNSIASKLSGYKINDIDKFIEELTLADVIGDVSVTDDSHAIMDYLVYGLTEVEDSGEDLSGYSVYKATHNPVDTSVASYQVWLLVDDSTGYIYGIYSDKDCTEEIDSDTISTSVDDINARMNGLMSDLTIGEITDLGDTAIANKLKTYKINDIDSFLDSLTLADVMEEVPVTGDSATILDYLVYGIRGLKLTNDIATVNSVSYDVYEATYYTYGSEDNNKGLDGSTVYVLVDGDSNIYAVYTQFKTEYTEDDDGYLLSGTPVANVTDRMNGIMNDLTLGELITIDGTSSVILQALSDSTINNLSSAVSDLKIQEVFYKDVYSEAEAAADEKSDASGNTAESYLKVVYESVVILSGTYYYYDGSDFASVNITSYDSTNKVWNDGTNTYKDGTVYWTDGNDTIYLLVAFDSAYLYKDSAGDYVGTDGHLDSFSDYSGSSILYTYGKPSGVWYFMVHNTSGVEQLYAIDAIESLVENAKSNINTATMNELYNAGILGSDVKDSLDTEISAATLNYVYYGTNTSSYTFTASTTLGAFTITEAINFIIKALGVITIPAG